MRDGEGAYHLTRENIVCFSTADWDTPLPTNKHHLMTRLAARNNRVLYIETLGTRAPRLGSGTDLGRIGRRLARGFAGPRKRARRLWTLSPVVRPRWKTAADIALNRTAFRTQAGRALAAFPKPIVWVYSPYAVHLLPLLEPRAVVYHMVDDLSAVPGADKEAIREAEAQLLSRADAIFCSERSLCDRARRVAPHAIHAPNVADFAHFSNVREIPSSTRLARVRALPRPRLLFSGNMTPHKVDFDLLDAIAEEKPEWQLILVGPEWEGSEHTAAQKRLAARRNVHALGHVPYEELPPYLHEADALLIPYILNDATRAVHPLKLFEYLATGRPVVASPLPSLMPYRGAVRIADGVEEWMAAIAGALEDTHEMEIQRRALARRHTWESRLKEIDRTLAGVLGQE